MSGVSLAELDASDMLDALHYLFEEQFTFTSEEHYNSKLKLQEKMYEDLYGEFFGYKISGAQGGPLPEGVNREALGVQVPADFDYTTPIKKRPKPNAADEELTTFNPRDRKPAPKAPIKATPLNPLSDRPFGMLLDPPVDSDPRYANKRTGRKRS